MQKFLANVFINRSQWVARYKSTTFFSCGLGFSTP